MPKVPVLGQRVEPTTLPSERFRVSPGPAAFGATEAGAIGRLGQQVERVGRIEAAEEEARFKEGERVKAEYAQRVDKLKASELVNEYADWQRQQGANYKTRTGVDAVGVTNDAIKDEEDIRRKISAKAGNPNIKALFESKALTKREPWLDGIKTGEVNEFLKAEKSNAEAGITNSINVSADINSSDLDRFLAAQDLTDSLEILNQGQPSEVVKNVESEAWSSFHAERVNALAPLNANMAQEYFNEHQKEMLPGAREELQGVLHTETTLQDSQAMADKIVLEETDESLWIDNARAATYTGSKEEQAKKRDATVNRLKTRKEELEQGRVESQKEAYLTALDQVDATQTLEEGLDKAARVVDPVDREKVRKHAHARFKKKKEGDIQTNLDIHATAWEEFNAGRLTTTRQLNQYAADLSTAHYNTLNSAIQSKSAKDRGAKVPEMDYNTALRSYKVAKDIETYDIKKHGREFMALYEVLNDAAKQKGDTLTLSEANALTAKTIVEGEVPRKWIWSDDKTRIQAEQSGQIDIWLPLINEDDVDNGQEDREVKDWFGKTLNITDPSDELMGLYKKEAILDIPLSPEQEARLNELIIKER